MSTFKLFTNKEIKYSGLFTTYPTKKHMFGPPYPTFMFITTSALLECWRYDAPEHHTRWWCRRSIMLLQKRL